LIIYNSFNKLMRNKFRELCSKFSENNYILHLSNTRIVHFMFPPLLKNDCLKDFIFHLQ
jgi:hypothetical protein